MNNLQEVLDAINKIVKDSGEDPEKIWVTLNSWMLTDVQYIEKDNRINLTSY